MKHPITIAAFEEITAAVWQSIMLLRSRVFVSEQRCVYTDPDAHDHSAHHAYITEGGIVVAYARFFHDHGWKIGRVVVSETHRKGGLAMQLMTAIMERIKSTDNQAEIALSAQAYLSLFYRKLGFQPVGRMYLEDEIPHVAMVYTRDT